ncbi:MAG: class I SAM-dependent methyltransferase [Pirellula sp.]|jgi:methyltransferase-like protein/2-polyprenyl-3-methyl-5-hydroxy-6-metoxy-1,4-benzoquinol methylase|nr:class I SAM-dependent methyltransferase [Pirellula sp.]
MSTVPQSSTVPQDAKPVSANPAASTYDEVPYGSYPVPASHPDRLYSMAKLFGMNPVPPENARILEIGCAGGGNLLPMASMFPNAQCVGVELSQVQCDYGSEAIKFTDFKNASIKQGSVTDIDASFGKFDYILCHGVFSWVPEFVREAILRVSSENLTDQGIAFISYNAQPGWYMRGMIRGMMIEHVRQIEEPIKKISQARALLKFLVDSNHNVNTPHAIFLRSEAELLAKMPDSYILHEHLEDTNHAFYFRDFIALAAKFNLQFLGEASIASTWPGNLSSEAQKGLNPINDAIARGHYMDCITGRTFRETYLVKSSSKVDRNLEDSRLMPLRFSGKFETVNDANVTDGSTSFKLKNGQIIHTQDPIVKGALEILTSLHPESRTADEIVTELENRKISFDSREQTVNKILSTLVHGVLGGWIEFRYLPDRMQNKVTRRPTVTTWARVQALANKYVTNQRHEFIRIDDAQRQIIPMLDGTRTLDDIISEVSVLLSTGLLTVSVKGNVDSKEIPKAVVAQVLTQLAQNAMLLPEPA